LSRWGTTVICAGDVPETLGVNKAFAATLLAKSVLSGKVENPGHQKDRIASEQAPLRCTLFVRLLDS
jgi:hypothetical protein